MVWTSHGWRTTRNTRKLSVAMENKRNQQGKHNSRSSWLFFLLLQRRFSVFRFPPTHPEQTNCGRNCGVSGILYWISLNSWRVKLNVTSTRCSAGWAKSDVFYCRAIKLKEWKYSVCAGYLPAIGKWTSKGIANWKVGQIASNQKQSIRNDRTPWEISFQHTPPRLLLQFSAVNLKCRQVICSPTRAEAANTSWGWFWLWSGNWIDQKKWFPNVTIK